MPKNVNLNKEVFTTFEVAKICNANITSIKNWIEDNQIRAFRTPGGHYRVQKDVLVDFLNRYGMPNPFQKKEERRLLLVCEDPATVELVRRAVGRESEVAGTDDYIEGALLIGAKNPDSVVIEIQKGDGRGGHLISTIRDQSSLNHVRIVAYAGEGVGPEMLPTNKNVEYFVRINEGIERLIEKVRQALI